MLLGGVLRGVGVVVVFLFVVVEVRLGCSFSDVWRGGLQAFHHCCGRILMMMRLRFLLLIPTHIRIRTLIVPREGSEKNRFLGDVVLVD